MPTPVAITACDNELYIVAIQSGGAGMFGSSELFHLKSGNNDPVATTFNLESVLPSGSYWLSFIGINWGGPAKFALTVGTNTYGTSLSSAALGVAWNQTVGPITV